MRHESLAKKRKMEASEINSTALAHVRTTSEHFDSDIPSTSAPTAIVDAAIRQDPSLEVGFAGYIFMCNAKTKRDCFIYRVFGLPAARIDVVEKIKPNAKLFLYDFDVKLLYGPYVADSVGKLALEPYAFGGRFPAQVKFSISNDCVPLPEAAFKDAIKENYLTKFKFKQDLSYEQVDKLVSLFRPLTLRSPKQASLVYPSYPSVPEIPLPSLHSTRKEIPLSRGGEYPSNLHHPRIAYGHYGSALSPQPYHPDDPRFQRHDTHLRNMYIPQQAINPVVPRSPPANSYYDQNKRLLHAAYPPQIQGSTPLPPIRSSSLPLGHHYQGYPGTTTAVNAYKGHLPSSSTFYSQTERPQPQISEVGAVNAYPYQPYSKPHQDVNNVAYGSQTYPNPQVPVPEASADPYAASIYSDYSTTGHTYYQAMPQTSDQSASGVHVQAYVQTQGLPGLAQKASADPYAASIYSNYSTTGHTYYQAMPQTSDQSANVQAYVQTQGLPGLAQTVPSRSGVVNNAYSYYNQGY